MKQPTTTLTLAAGSYRPLLAEDGTQLLDEDGVTLYAEPTGAAVTLTIGGGYNVLLQEDGTPLLAEDGTQLWHEGFGSSPTLTTIAPTVTLAFKETT